MERQRPQAFRPTDNPIEALLVGPGVTLLEAPDGKLN